MIISILVMPMLLTFLIASYHMRAGELNKWLKMVLIPFCKLLRVREGWLPQGIHEQMRSPKLSPNHKR